MSDLEIARLFTPVWRWMLTAPEAEYLTARETAEIVAAVRVAYVALGGHVKEHSA